MNEAQSNEPEAIATTAGQQAVESAFAQTRDLPFFDLDIALIRRDPHAALQSAVQPRPLPAVSPAGPKTILTREQQALAALESLLTDRQRAPVQPVALFPAPALAPQPTLTPTLQTRTIAPQIMPAASVQDEAPNFVSPEFARPTATAALEPTTTVAKALLQTAQQISQQLPDELPQLKLSALHQAVRVREARLERMAAALRYSAAKPINAAPTDATVIADDQPDELPWGHATYRLLVM